MRTITVKTSLSFQPYVKVLMHECLATPYPYIEEAKINSDVHALIKELTIIRVEHRSEIRSNESQHLVKETEAACFWRRFSFDLKQTFSFRTCHHLCRQGVALAGTQQLRLQGPVSVLAYCTERVAGSEGREGANGVGGGIGVGSGNRDGNWVEGENGDVNGEGGADGDGAGTGTGVEASERTQDGNGDGSGDGAGTGTGVETRGRTKDENGDGSSGRNESGDTDGNEDGNEDGTREDGGEAKKCKKPHKSCGRDVGNGGDWAKREKRRQERIGSAATDADNLENGKEAAREHEALEA